MKKTESSFITSIGLAVSCLALLLQFSTQASCGAAIERPNFVFIYTDDQRWDALGVVQKEQGEKARFPWLESPNLDRLASEGVRFRNAFVVTALCAPSRAAFLTGCYGHVNGVVNNHTPFPTDSVTHASLMRAAGYRTGYIGKWHMGSQSGQRPGFDFSASFVGQGVYFDCPIEVNGVKQPSQGWVDDVSTDFAIQFIRENQARSFSLVLGYKTCHGPFTPPPRMAEAYATAEANLVPSLNSPAIYKGVESKPRGTPKTPVAPANKPVASETGKVKTNLGMFRGLKAIDENVGKLLAVLDELQLAENTVVVYSSDNGFYLGEHGLGDKRSAYEESMRVPLLLRYPRLKVKGKVIDQMVLNIDLAPTWLDLAGIAIPNSMDGRSWKPLLTDDASGINWRKSFLYSYFREGQFATPTVVALRTEQAKLILYPGRDDWTEVFHLPSDPYEINNLNDVPAQANLKRELQREYESQVKAVKYHVPSFADESRKPQAADSKALEPENAWVLDYRGDPLRQGKVTDQSKYQNHGSAQAVTSVEGRNGKSALGFNGESMIEVPDSKSLDPSVGSLAIEAVVKPDGDGVVMARGGRSLGFLLAIVQGKPMCAYRSTTGLVTLTGNSVVQGEWVTIQVRVTSRKNVVLSVNGTKQAEGTVDRFIHKQPNDGMQIGADLGSTVIETALPQFRGLIEQVRIYSGELRD